MDLTIGYLPAIHYDNNHSSAVKINRTFISNYVLLLNNDYVCSTTKLNAIQYCGVQFSIDCLLTGIASAFQTPTLSLYLLKRFKFHLFVGLFYSVNAIIGIILSQILAKYSDKQEDRRKVMIVCCLIAVFIVSFCL